MCATAYASCGIALHTPKHNKWLHSFEINFSFVASSLHWHQNHAFYLCACCGIEKSSRRIVRSSGNRNFWKYFSKWHFMWSSLYSRRFLLQNRAHWFLRSVDRGLNESQYFLMNFIDKKRTCIAWRRGIDAQTKRVRYCPIDKGTQCNFQLNMVLTNVLLCHWRPPIQLDIEMQSIRNHKESAHIFFYIQSHQRTQDVLMNWLRFGVFHVRRTH